MLILKKNQQMAKKHENCPVRKEHNMLKVSFFDRWMYVVSLASSVVKNFFKGHLLHYWLEFIQTWEHSGSVVECLIPRGCGFEPHQRHWVVSLGKTHQSLLRLNQQRKTRPNITEKLLTGKWRIKSNKLSKLDAIMILMSCIWPSSIRVQMVPIKGHLKLLTCMA